MRISNILILAFAVIVHLDLCQITDFFEPKKKFSHTQSFENAFSNLASRTKELNANNIVIPKGSIPYQAFNPHKKVEQSHNDNTFVVCKKKNFCHKQNLLVQKILKGEDARLKDLAYVVDKIKVDQSSVILEIVQLQKNFFFAVQLTANLTFYQDGILRLHFKEHKSPLEDDLFRASDHEGVEEQQLRPVEDLQSYLTMTDDLITVKGLNSDDYKENFEYQIHLDPFKIELFIDSQNIITVNPTGNGIVWENSRFYYGVPNNNDQEILAEIIKDCELCQSIIDINVKDDSECFSFSRFEPLDGPYVDYKQSVSMGFHFPMDHLYGLPQRAYDFKLPTTEIFGPYRLFNQDLFPHSADSMTNLYGSIPYLTGHSEFGDASVAWMNSADTWVHILDYPNKEQPGKFVSFISEAPSMEFFIFGSRIGPNRVQKCLADISGYPQMPPAYSLGFHFSKWDYISAETMIARNQLFSDHKYQVDVLWFDIDYTFNKQYFKFNNYTFPPDYLEKMNAEVFKFQRRFVVITDPHIRAHVENPVYEQGNQIEAQIALDRNTLSNIWIKQPDGMSVVKECWPGRSSWVDFLNTNAQEFWHNLMLPQFFNGTNSNYSFWIDMNEPSVFQESTLTLPLNSIHITSQNKRYLHRDVHNMYGALQHKTAFRGMLKRDNYKYRPFVLTRSFYFGSQKYGAYWTGDNKEGFQEFQTTISMLLSAGVAGLPFAGSDVPSFHGEHTSHTIVNGYQLGVFMPFFRAHSHEDFKLREPWLLTEREQQAIHAALDLRYRLFPYLYTTFYLSSQSGLPIWRPMYYDQPQDKFLWDVESQFMFGSQILVSPKVNQKFLLVEEEITLGDFSLINDKTTPIYEIDPVFPEIYFDWNSKQLIQPGIKQLFLSDFDIPMYIKAGTVLPLLNVHENQVHCHSLQQCYNNSLTLDVYLSQNTNEQLASGILYLDDGITYEQKGNVFKLTYVKNTLWLTRIQIGDLIDYRIITRVNIYGLNFVTDTNKIEIQMQGEINGGRQKVVADLKDGGFSFDINFSTGNLALLSSVPIIFISRIV